MTSATSIAAFRGSTTLIESVRDNVLGIVDSFGAAGCISDEILAYFPVEKKTGSVNSRYSELENDGLLFRKGDTRAGLSGHQQAVWRHIRYAPPGFVPPKPVGKKNPFYEGMKFAAKFLIKTDPTLKGTPAIVSLVAEIRKVGAK